MSERTPLTYDEKVLLTAQFWGRQISNDASQLAELAAPAVEQIVAAARADERKKIRQRIAGGPSCGVASRDHDGCYVQDALRACDPPDTERLTHVPAE